MIVVDNSAVIEWLTGSGPAARAVEARLSGRRLLAPEVVDLEAACALRRFVRNGVLGAAGAERLLRDLQDLTIERFPHAPLLPRIWELRDNLTAYDAAYVALAEALEAPLLTLDARLANAPGLRCAVELVR